MINLRRTRLRTRRSLLLLGSLTLALAVYLLVLLSVAAPQVDVMAPKLIKDIIVS